MKKTYHILTTIILLIGISFTTYAQEPALHTFKGTAWHIEQIVTTKNGASQTQQYQANENVIKIGDNATYEITNFMGKDTTLTGYWVETQNVISLSSSQGDAYFWVFEIASKNLNEVRLNYVHFKEDGESIELLMKPFRDSLQDVDNQPDSTQFNTNSNSVNMEGDWTWEYPDDEVKMEIQLNQIKTALTGAYTYTKAGAKTAYFLSGELVGEEAKINILNAEKVLLAKIEMVKVGETLQWKKIEKEAGQTVLTIPNVNFEKAQ
jgi:hypothetical protein